MQKNVEILTQQYQQLCQSYLDLERLNWYLMSHHSTAIEGSTLTVLETEIFLDKGLTAKNKPLEHHLMVKDHFETLGFVMAAARQKKSVDVRFVQDINAHVMHSTGTIYQTSLGTFDAAKGDLRLLNVRAGISGDSYMNYDKVPMYLKKLCQEIEAKINTLKTVEEINDFSFHVHYQLVTIHPFVDGNGRTARLLMNFVQAYHTLPMTIVFVDDRQEYIESLVATRKNDDIELFTNFMRSQHIKFLEDEIEKLGKV